MYDTIMLEACHHTFIQTHIEHTISRVKCREWLWVVMMYQCRFISYNKYAAPCASSYPSVMSVSLQTRLLCSWKLQARITEWVAISFSRGFSQSRDWTCISCVSCIAGKFFTHWITGEAHTTQCGEFCLCGSRGYMGILCINPSILLWT